MNILIAPDKFKDSLTAAEVCQAIEEGLREAKLSFTSRAVPMADGGEGTCALLTRYSAGREATAHVNDPLGRTIPATYGISNDGTTAFIEMASASGIQLLRPGERNVAYTSTVGTGQLIADALRQGVKHIILGIGGSATNDGGMGMAHALGARFYASPGVEIEPLGKNLIHLNTIDSTALPPSLKGVRLTALCDVNNPLYGPQGAALVFAPQKGADPETVLMLDRGLRTLARVASHQYGIDLNFPGAGAGGGIGACARLFLNAEFISGAEFLLKFFAVEKLVSESDAVISGEGKVDAQTLSGKVVHAIAGLCLKHKKPLYVITGKNELPASAIDKFPIRQVFTLSGQSVSEEEAMANAFSVLKEVVRTKVAPQLKGNFP